ncbi:MAG: hypothetical protein HPY79_10415 [Bacteroidales bacterium]|nr:hypothetical protein [Bacteroidales bacterium]
MFEYTYKNLDNALNRIYPNVKPDTNALYENLRRNLIQTSAYKSYWQTQQLNDSLSGKMDKKPEQINNDFNVNYMRTEYVHTVRSARMAQRWTEFEANKHVYPYLEYMPSTAAEPRMEHQKFYGIIKPVDDPFWDTWLPPNGWGCKCSVRPVRNNNDAKPLPADMPPMPPKAMQHNPAKTGEIFSNETSYFKKVKTELPQPKQQAVREAFELLKETIPYELAYQSKGKVYTHIFKEEPEKYNENLETAKLLADNFDMEIKIRPLINADNYKNPDFIINGLFADQAIYGKSKNFYNFITNSFKDKFSKKRNGQLNKTGGYLILSFSQKIVIDIKYIKNKLNFYKDKCFKVFIINGNEIFTL